MTTAFLELRQKVRAAIGDGYREAVTTALAASTTIASTNLNKWDGGLDDYFNEWFAYIEDYNNAGVNRVISDYANSGGSCTVRGGNLTAETGSEKATVMFTKFNPDNYKLAIQRAIRKLDSKLYIPLDDRSLITGNILPNSHFEDWAVTTVPDFYTAPAGSAAETTTAGLYRGARGTSSCLVTASGADDYMYSTSNDYPRLLDLMGKTVTFKSWAYPSKVDDAFLTIYTIQADGTAQTLNSTTACPITKWTLLKLEDQALNDDLVEIQFRFRVHSDGETCYFDNSRVTGLNIYEYLLPTDFRDGNLSQVFIQTSKLADDPCDDLHILTQEKVYGWDIIDDGTYKYLRLPYTYANKRLLHLIGYKSLTVPTTDAGTVEVDDPDLELLIAKSALELYRIQQGLVSAYDRDAYKREIADWEWEVRKLEGQFEMTRPSQTLRIKVF